MASSSSSLTSPIGTGGSPCGACKFLRRKCASDCIFAPYFASELGPDRFAAIHKVFGASNVSKLLLHVPVPDRYEAVVTISYEAQARIRDPVYGCVSHILALQKQVACLQAQVMQAKAQLLAQNLQNASRSNYTNKESSNQWNGNVGVEPNFVNNYYNYRNPISPQSSLESMDHDMSIDQQQVISFQSCSNYTRPFINTTTSDPNHLGELQALALKMMRI